MAVKMRKLYSLTKTGKIQQFRVWSEGAYVFTEYGQVGGKLQRTPGKLCAGTNAGRANERTAEAQADFVARATFKFRLQRGYSKNPEDAREAINFSPMLAQTCRDVGELKYPVYTQNKYDGVRALAYWGEDSEIHFMPKSGVGEYQMPHIAKILKEHLPLDWAMDGEFYKHGFSCQQIISLCKKNRPESAEIGYHVYDLAIPDHTFKQRNALVTGWFNERKKALKNNIYRAKTRITEYEVILKEHYKNCLSDGFEGMMIRLPDGLYEFGHRSKSLLKLKPTADAEFVVDRVRTGVGKMDGCAIFVCKTAEGKTFECMMACPQKERQEQWKHKEDFYGRKLTVMYQDLTDDGIPRFPRGKCFREEKDLT